MPTQKSSSRPARKPHSTQGTTRRNSLAILPALGIAVVLGVVLTAGGFGFAATQEQHDAFCASCHTQPESTYYQRATSAQPVDLASAHTPKAVQCIGCHAGPGLTGRMSAELLGARNAVHWYTKTAVQPAKLTYPIPDQNCLKCHEQVTASRSRDNHFHAFLARWQAADPQAATCVSCHGGHTTDGSADLAFLNQERTQAVCEACHGVLRGGD
jgi:nitrate/TMAO reductase-like tetraheme cytochrome c subunit